MMSGDGHPSRAGRLTALATLAVSATMFLTALFGIASINPAADASGPATPVPATKSISLDPAVVGSERDHDCPWRGDGKRDARDERPGARSTS